MHTFKTKNFNGSILDLYKEDAVETLQKYIEHIKKLKDIGAPTLVIDDYQNRHDKLEKKLNNGTYTPSLTYRDGLDKSVLNTRINEYKEEYNRNGKLVAIYINNEFKINYNTRYNPIITKIV